MKKPLEDILLQIHQFATMHRELHHQLDTIQSQRDMKLSAMQRELDEEEQAAGSGRINMRDSYVGSVLMPHSKMAGDGDSEYQAQYAALRKKQGEVVYVLQSFHTKIAKLLELPKLNKVIPEYLERLLVQLDFNDFHLNSQMQQTRLSMAADLPIHPFPMASFLKIKKSNDRKDSARGTKKDSNRSNRGSGSGSLAAKKRGNDRGVGKGGTSTNTSSSSSGSPS